MLEGAMGQGFFSVLRFQVHNSLVFIESASVKGIAEIDVMVLIR